MKLFPLNKNSIALLFVGVITIGFFIAGLSNILDYIIIKVLLFSGSVTLVIVAIGFALKNDTKKKSP